MHQHVSAHRLVCTYKVQLRCADLSSKLLQLAQFQTHIHNKIWFIMNINDAACPSGVAVATWQRWPTHSRSTLCIDEVSALLRQPSRQAKLTAPRVLPRFYFKEIQSVLKEFVFAAVREKDNRLQLFFFCRLKYFRQTFSMFPAQKSARPLTYDGCCLSLYQTQLFSLLPKQIDSLITFQQPAQATTPDQYPAPPPPPYLSFTTEEYTSHTQGKPSWVNLHARPPTPLKDSSSCPPCYWFPFEKNQPCLLEFSSTK